MRVGTFVLAAQFPGQGQGEALHRAVRTAEVAEEAGLDSVWLAEHHFVPYGVCPSAVTLAALILGRTRRLRVGTAVSVLPNVHPVALGEQQGRQGDRGRAGAVRHEVVLGQPDRVQPGLLGHFRGPYRPVERLPLALPRELGSQHETSHVHCFSCFLGPDAELPHPA